MAFFPHLRSEPSNTAVNTQFAAPIFAVPLFYVTRSQPPAALRTVWGGSVEQPVQTLSVIVAGIIWMTPRREQAPGALASST